MAITSFIFGMDNDTPGVAERTLEQIRSWTPGLPVFGQLTPLPATPLYDRLKASGRLIRPDHWMDFAPFQMAHTPLKMTIEEVKKELDQAWSYSYSSEALAEAVNSIQQRPVWYRASLFITRLFFRGIYFPQMNKRAWAKLIAQNWRTILKLIKDGAVAWHHSRQNGSAQEQINNIPQIQEQSDFVQIKPQRHKEHKGI